MIKFEIKINEEYTEHPHTIDIVIYPTRAAFVKEHTKEYTDDIKLTMALCIENPLLLSHNYEDNTWTATGMESIATVCFYKGGISTEAICHEMTHAALCTYRADYNNDARLGTDSGSNEEEHLAYIIGDLCTKMMKELIIRDIPHTVGSHLTDKTPTTPSRKPEKAP